MDEAQGLTGQEFEQMMEGFPAPPSHMAVACSGGPDSMALASLLREWLGKSGKKLTALIVDHGLRPESAEEAKQVQSWLVERDIQAEILTHSGVTPLSDIQNRAREIRYGLLRDWCRQNEVQDLAIGHHLDDQAETFLMRLARGSGVDGLSAMSSLSNWNGLALWRPLLPVSKIQLIKMLERRAIPYVKDPSNEKDIYTRNRLRAVMPQLAKEGMDADRLSATATHMARASEALDHYVKLHLSQNGRLFQAGYVRLELAGFLEAPDEICLRGLSRILRLVGGNDYPTRFEKLTALFEKLPQWKSGEGATLAGCQLQRVGPHLWIAREYQSDAATFLNAENSILWDRRFEVSFRSDAELVKGLKIDFLGENGVSQARERGLIEPDFEHLPGFVRRVLPGLFQNDRLLSVLCGRKSDQGQEYGIEQIRLIGADFYSKTAFSSALWRTM